MEESTTKLTSENTPESPDFVQANHLNANSLKLLDDFTVSQFEWINRCLGDDYKQQSKRWETVEVGMGQLRNFECRIAVTGDVGVGKTTILNTLLDFPYMPTASGLTTDCYMDIRYGEKPEIKVFSPNDEKKFLIPIEQLSEEIFRDMKSYVVNYLIRYYGVNSLDCLMRPYGIDYESGKPIVDESMLHIDYSNLSHRAALVLHVLSFYVDQNVESEEEQPLVREVNEKRISLLRKLGIPENVSEYDLITFKVNSPLLKDGLVFVSLPGNGNLASYNYDAMDIMKKCRVVMPILDPRMTSNITEKILDNITNFLKENKYNTLIPVLNKMDLPGAFSCKYKLDTLFNDRGLNCSFDEAFKISAIKAEKRIFDSNPDISVEYSNAAKTALAMGIEVNDSQVHGMLEKRAKESNFDTLHDYLRNCIIDSEREKLCLEMLFLTYCQLEGYLEKVCNSQQIRAEDQVIRDCLAEIKLSLPFDDSRLDLKDPHKKEVWELCQEIYQIIVKLLEPYRENTAVEEIITENAAESVPESPERVQAIRTNVSGLNLLEEVALLQFEWMDRFLNEDYKKKSQFVELARKGRELLRNFSYRIGVAGVQSAGKTTVLNTLLDFPYMPTAEVVTTSCSTSIMYGETPELEIVSRDKKKKVLISMERLPADLFRDMKAYVVNYLIRQYGATSLNCLMEDYMLDLESGKPIVDESMLHVDYSNLRHRAAMALHVLSFYVDQNVESEERQLLVREVNEKRINLLKRLGIPEDMPEYDIIFRVNSPLLKDGLVFVDLPGKGADVSAGNGLTSQDEIMLTVMGTCEAVMLLFEPQMRSDTIKPLDDVISFFKNKQIENSRIGTALIPVLNRMDIPGASGYQTKIDSLFTKRNLNFSYSKGMFRISASLAEKRFFDANPDMSVQYSSAAKLMGGEGSVVCDNLAKRAKKSNFDSLYNYLKNYADASRETVCLELMLNIYRAFNEYLEKTKASLHIKESLLGVFVENSDKLIRLIKEQMQDPMNKEFTTFQDNYEKEVDDFFYNVFSKKISSARLEFLNRIVYEHMSMVDELEEQAETLDENLIGDIVLWRTKKGYIKEYVEPNYSNYQKLKSIVEKNKYDIASDYLRSEFTNLHQEAQNLSDTTERNLESNVMELMGSVRERCDKLEKTLRQEQYDENIISVLTHACDEIRKYCNTVDISVQTKIKAISILGTTAFNDALMGAFTVKSIAQQKLLAFNTEIFNQVITHGRIRGSTELVRRASINLAILIIKYEDDPFKFKQAISNATPAVQAAYKALLDSSSTLSQTIFAGVLLFTEVISRYTSDFISRHTSDSVKYISMFEQVIDTAKSDFTLVYRKLFTDKEKILQDLWFDIFADIEVLVKSITDNFARNEEDLKAEIQEMRDYLAGIKPLLLTDDSDRLGLTDPQALKTWEAIRKVHDHTIELLKPYRKER